MTWDKNIITYKNGSIILMNYENDIELMVITEKGRLKQSIKLTHKEFQDLLNTTNELQRGYINN